VWKVVCLPSYVIERNFLVRKRCFLRIALLLVLIPTLFLQGCWVQLYPENEIAEPDVPLEENIPSPDIPITVTPKTPGRFTLRYDSKSSLNPITTLNRDNILLSSLLYESLFFLDGDLNAKPLLCENWSTEDNTTYTFELKPNVAMNDGSWLTADDVVYTYKQSMQKGRYISRFNEVNSFASDGGLTVTVVLSAPNSRFINLLDVPIIKSGSIGNSIPPGTGPYTVTEDGVMRLDQFYRHRDFFNLPVSSVYLRECGDNELTELFDDGELSLLWDDPSDAFDLRINRLSDKRFYKTTALQYVGFNARKGVMRDPDVRRAIACSIDRQYIVDNILTGHQAIASPLALSPAFRLYDKAWEHHDTDPLVEMTLLLDRAGFEDFDDDSFLEIWDGFDGYSKFTVDFIVNIENTYKTQIAHKIADTLKRNGFNITVRELPWEDYLAALQAGNFDLYYGEIMLNADFNLSPLLLSGSQINYGRTASSDYAPFVEEFLTARSDNEVRYAAKRLCDEISEYAPFAPVVYKKQAIYFPMGAISGAAPSQSGVFYDFTNWTIDLMMLT